MICKKNSEILMIMFTNVALPVQLFAEPCSECNWRSRF